MDRDLNDCRTENTSVSAAGKYVKFCFLGLCVCCLLSYSQYVDGTVPAENSLRYLLWHTYIHTQTHSQIMRSAHDCKCK
jgi:hypothetical protein